MLVARDSRPETLGNLSSSEVGAILASGNLVNLLAVTLAPLGLAACAFLDKLTHDTRRTS